MIGQRSVSLEIIYQIDYIITKPPTVFVLEISPHLWLSWTRLDICLLLHLLVCTWRDETINGSKGGIPLGASPKL